MGVHPYKTEHKEAPYKKLKMALRSLYPGLDPDCLGSNTGS